MYKNKGNDGVLDFNTNKDETELMTCIRIRGTKEYLTLTRIRYESELITLTRIK